MDDRTKAEYETQCQRLRVDLKTWESNWAKNNGGKKPGRDDIKRNPDIAQKYKNYQKYRDILNGKALPTQQQQQQSNSRKRRSEPPAPPAQTPSKRSRHAIETPSNHHFHDEHLEETPTISRKLFSPTAVTSLGPTPQRDGRVLGLFDLLQEEEEEEEEQGGPVDSPSKKHQTTRHSAGEARSKIHATPSKRPSSTTDMAVTPRMGRTPMSASKRQYLNTFMSPLKSRDANTPGPNTPSSRLIHLDETPQFLKRYSGGLAGMVDENGEFDVPAQPLRLPRKPMGRGLSEIVASLRKVEEEQADEDLEALREMEAEEAAAAGGAPVTRQPLSRPAADEQVLVPGTQNQRLPLGGFDDEGMYDSPVEEGKGTDGNPMRVFKKKGQKRTTRKVNMKPVWIKRPTETTTQREADGEDEDDDVVQKTQLGDGDEPAANVSSDSEFDDGKTATKKSKKKSKKKNKESRSKAGKEPKEGTVKKAARKVNELAHANFQRLKLRQNGAKGGPGYNSKFRRRR